MTLGTSSNLDPAFSESGCQLARATAEELRTLREIKFLALGAKQASSWLYAEWCMCSTHKRLELRAIMNRALLATAPSYAWRIRALGYRMAIWAILGLASLGYAVTAQLRYYRVEALMLDYAAQHDALERAWQEVREIVER